MESAIIFLATLIILPIVSGQSENSTINETTTQPTPTLENVDNSTNTSNSNLTTLNKTESPVDGLFLRYPSFDAKYDHCSCDLKLKFCDINCCCDVDCSEEEKRIFAFCEEVKHSTDDGDYCFREFPVYSNNTKFMVQESSSGLFCILYDNTKEKQLYPDRKPVSTIQEVRRLWSNKMFAWRQDQQSEETVPFGRSFRYGDPIWATSVTGRGIEINEILRLPAASLATGGFCDTFKPIVYLVDTSFSCLRDIKNFQVDCKSQPFLSPPMYFENVFINKMGSVKNLEPETRSYYQIEYDFSEQPSGSSLATRRPVNWTKYVPLFPNCVALNECIPILWDPDQNFQITRLVHRSQGEPPICSGVVSMINYTFFYHPADGIDSVKVAFQFTELKEARPVRQTFNIAFVPNDAYMVNKSLHDYEFSGNAGYIFGKSVLFKSSTTNTSTVSGYRIPVVRHGNGQCSNDSMHLETVKFGINCRSGCMMNTSHFLMENSMCQSIQREIIKLLDGYNKELTSVAIYGNPNTSEPSDWIPILIDDEPTILSSDSVPRLTADERCPALITGYSLDIFYALVGPESQSQAKVISVVKRFNKPIDVRVSCHSLLCQFRGNSFLLELSIAVNFIDATFPIETKFAPPPIFKFQLPSDFFYPFLTSSAHRLTLNNYYTIHLSKLCIPFISIILIYLSDHSTKL